MVLFIQIHERRHTGEKPYLCPVCAKGFKRKEALDNHAVTHMDVPKVLKTAFLIKSYSK